MLSSLKLNWSQKLHILSLISSAVLHSMLLQFLHRTFLVCYCCWSSFFLSFQIWEILIYLYGFIGYGLRLVTAAHLWLFRIFWWLIVSIFESMLVLKLRVNITLSEIFSQHVNFILIVFQLFLIAIFDLLNFFLVDPLRVC